MYYMPCIDSKQKLVLKRVRLFAQIINALAANPSADTLTHTHSYTLTCILAHSVSTCVSVGISCFSQQQFRNFHNCKARKMEKSFHLGIITMHMTK